MFLMFGLFYRGLRQATPRDRSMEFMAHADYWLAGNRQIDHGHCFDYYRDSCCFKLVPKALALPSPDVLKGSEPEANGPHGGVWREPTVETGIRQQRVAALSGATALFSFDAIPYPVWVVLTGKLWPSKMVNQSAIAELWILAERVFYWLTIKDLRPQRGRPGAAGAYPEFNRMPAGTTGNLAASKEKNGAIIDVRSHHRRLCSSITGNGAHLAKSPRNITETEGKWKRRLREERSDEKLRLLVGGFVPGVCHPLVGLTWRAV